VVRSKSEAAIARKKGLTFLVSAGIAVIANFAAVLALVARLGVIGQLASIPTYVAIAFGGVLFIIGFPIFVTGLVYYKRRHDSHKH
jgi:hypothetical protein